MREIDFQVLSAPLVETWLYVASYQHKHGFVPSIREIQKRFGLKSHSTAHYRLNQLKAQGIINRKEKDFKRGRAYTLFVWPPPDSFVDVDCGEGVCDETG
ncbi:hypothetical protein ACFLYO_00345 [Chloroflexota bacterium]